MARIVSTPDGLIADAPSRHSEAIRLCPMDGTCEATRVQGDIACYCPYGIRVQRVSAVGWLVRSIQPVNGGLTLWASINRIDERFELLELHGGARWSTFESVDEAVAHVIVGKLTAAQKTAAQKTATPRTALQGTVPLGATAQGPGAPRGAVGHPRWPSTGSW